MSDKKAGKARFCVREFPNAPAGFGALTRSPAADYPVADRRSSPLRRLRKDAVRDGVPRAGALEHGEPGVFVAFERTNGISRKRGLPGLRPGRSRGPEKTPRRLRLDRADRDPGDGEYDLEGCSSDGARHRFDRAKRVVLDTIESLFADSRTRRSCGPSFDACSGGSREGGLPPSSRPSAEIPRSRATAWKSMWPTA